MQLDDDEDDDDDYDDDYDDGDDQEEEREKERETERKSESLAFWDGQYSQRDCCWTPFYRDHANTCQYLCFYLCHLIRTLSVTQFN